MDEALQLLLLVVLFSRGIFALAQLLAFAKAGKEPISQPSYKKHIEYKICSQSTCARNILLHRIAVMIKKINQNNYES